MNNIVPMKYKPLFCDIHTEDELFACPTHDLLYHYLEDVECLREDKEALTKQINILREAIERDIRKTGGNERLEDALEVMDEH